MCLVFGFSFSSLGIKNTYTRFILVTSRAFRVTAPMFTDGKSKKNVTKGFYFMASIVFKGLCSGTETRHSNKSGKDYQITSFVEIPTLNKFEIFGNLGLVAHEDVREYVLEAGVVGLSNVVVKSAGPNSPKKS